MKFPKLFFLPKALCCSVLVPIATAGLLDHPKLKTDDYPVALAALDSGKLLDIVAADSSTQEALDSQGSSIDVSSSKLFLAKGSEFAEGEIKVASSSAHALGESQNASLSTYRQIESEGTVIEATIVPTRNYTNVVMAAIFFTYDGRHEIVAESIGDLAAGSENYVSLMNPASYDFSSQKIEYSLLFFSDQGEIVSEFRKRASILVDQMFYEFYREFVASYQLGNRELSRGVSLVHRFPMDFSGMEDAVAKQNGTTYFTLDIDETGLVSEIRANEHLNDRLRERCERSLKEWLFLPAIKDGFAERSSVRVPVHWD